MKFIIFCPDQYTGGPFALLQLNAALRDSGLNSEVLFYNIGSIKFDGFDAFSVVYSRDPELNIKDLPYSTCKSFKKTDILIFPEVLLEMSTQLKSVGCDNRVFWWLSWDNAPLSLVNNINHYTNLKDSVHIFQSFYSQIEAGRLGFSGSMVSDYTMFNEEHLTEHHDKTNDICYLARKAPGCESIIKQLNNKFSVIAIENMSQEEVQMTLRKSRFFVDFGSHPGKDRIPREAALYGCIPLVRKVGAANYSEDVFIPEFLKLESPLFLNSEYLSGYIKSIDLERDSVLSRLRPYVSRIKQEYVRFNQEVKDFLMLNYNI
ncbi:hypothetical protein ACFQGA_10470 [Marinobacter koreensis]|uniref:Glycosyltransferase family 1 protein n=1 Tax=Marinobacter koreensis TaxID=335974 RepID=A0ABW0RKW0_9GAMM|nr:hypothetical protein [Marinobacter koreensis]MCK7547359.1 hypothetical protein [Marinobacter koreensis]